MPRTKEVTLYSFEELSEKAKQVARQWWLDSEDSNWDGESFGKEVLMESAHYCHGLPEDMQCHYSLAYCQGDGVAFYGRIDLDEICKLPDLENEEKSHFPTYDLRAEMAGIVEELESMDFSIYAKSQGERGRYHSYHTMDVTVDVEGGPDFPSRWNDLLDLVDDLKLPESEELFTWDAALQIAIEEDDVAKVLVFCDWAEEKGKDVGKIRTLFKVDKEIGDKRSGELRKLLVEYLKQVSRHTEKAGYAELEFRRSDEHVDEEINCNEYWFAENGDFVE